MYTFILSVIFLELPLKNCLCGVILYNIIIVIKIIIMLLNPMKNKKKK